MEKKYAVILAFFSLVFAGVLAYAWAFDTDGGFNPPVQGTCVDNFGNHADVCLNNITLGEYYPMTNASNFTYCTVAKYSCVNGNTTMCVNGRCV